MVAGSLVLADHPVNRARIKAGKPPANAIWLWGQGKAPSVPKFAELHRLKGAIISAVDLVRGVGMLAGWTRIDVPGATGYLDTDYAAKGRFAIAGAREITTSSACMSRPPTRPATKGGTQAKVEALERIDHDIVGPVRQALESYDRWRILISPDHSTLLQDPRPRPRAGGLGDGRHRAAGIGQVVRRSAPLGERAGPSSSRAIT